MTDEDVLREALDQYVSNQADHVETCDDPSDLDVLRLSVAERLLDELNTSFVIRLNV